MWRRTPSPQCGHTAMRRWVGELPCPVSRARRSTSSRPASIRHRRVSGGLARCPANAPMIRSRSRRTNSVQDSSGSGRWHGSLTRRYDRRVNGAHSDVRGARPLQARMSARSPLHRVISQRCFAFAMPRPYRMREVSRFAHVGCGRARHDHIGGRTMARRTRARLVEAVVRPGGHLVPMEHIHSCPESLKLGGFSSEDICRSPHGVVGSSPRSCCFMEGHQECRTDQVEPTQRITRKVDPQAARQLR